MFNVRTDTFKGMDRKVRREYFIEYFYDILIREKDIPMIKGIEATAYTCGFISENELQGRTVPKFQMSEYIEALQAGDRNAWAKLMNYSREIYIVDSESDEQCKIIRIPEVFLEMSPFKGMTIMYMDLTRGTINIMVPHENSKLWDTIINRFGEPAPYKDLFVTLPEIDWGKVEIIDVS